MNKVPYISEIGFINFKYEFRSIVVTHGGDVNAEYDYRGAHGTLSKHLETAVSIFTTVKQVEIEGNKITLKTPYFGGIVHLNDIANLFRDYIKTVTTEK